MLSHASDVAVWGYRPLGHHLTNVLLHSVNAAWVFLLGLALLRARRPAVIGMAFAALLFAVHPLRAESVSWISDRKDLLCVFFLLPAVAAYLRYASARESGYAARWYAASFALFALAALSKLIAVMTPFLLLLLDWLWLYRPRTSRARLLLEKVPFFLVSLILAIVSAGLSPAGKKAYAVAHLTGAETWLYPFHSLTFSLVKTLLPIHLGPIYPRVGFAWEVLGLAVFLTITGICAWQARRGRNGVLLAWLAYLLLLIPNVAGLSSGMQPVADRYSYLSTISLFLLLGGFIASAWEKGSVRRRLAIGVAFGALVVILAGLSVTQIPRWKSSITLWESAIAGAPAQRDYADAYLNLGAAYAESHRPADARRILERAREIDPSNAEVLYNLGVLVYLNGDRERAVRLFQDATRADPRHAKAFFNLAIILDELGRDAEAVSAMRQAARLGSRDAQDALTSRGFSW